MANEIQRIRFYTHNGGSLVAPVDDSVLLVTGSNTTSTIENPTAEDVGASIAIAESATAADDDISHSWDTGADADWENTLTIEFVGEFAGTDITQLTFDASDVICSSTRATITVDDVGSDAVAEVITIEFDHVPTGGTVTWAYSGYSPGSAQSAASASDAGTLEFHLEGLYGLTGTLSVTGTAGSGYTVTCNSAGEQPLLTYDDNQLTWGVTEEQTITFSPTPDAGSYTITYNGRTTDTLSHSALANAIQSDLNFKLAEDGKSVTITGDYSSGFTITCDQEGNQSEATVDTSALFSGRAHEVQRITFDLVPDDGTWTAAGETLAFDANAAAVETALETALSSGVSVAGDYSNGFDITFDDYTNHSEIVVDDTSLLYDSGPVTATVSTTTDGNPGTVTATVTTTRQGSGPTPVNITITRTTTGTNGTPWTATISAPTGEWRVKGGANFTESIASDANAATIKAAWEASALLPVEVDVVVNGDSTITITSAAVGVLNDSFLIVQTCYVVVDTVQEGGTVSPSSVAFCTPYVGIGVGI